MDSGTGQRGAAAAAPRHALLVETNVP